MSLMSILRWSWLFWSVTEVLAIFWNDAASQADHSIEKNVGHKWLIEQPSLLTGLQRVIPWVLQWILWQAYLGTISLLKWSQYTLYISNEDGDDDDESDVNVPVTDVCTMQTFQTADQHPACSCRLCEHFSWLISLFFYLLEYVPLQPRLTTLLLYSFNC